MHALPAKDRMTDACEKVPFPQLLLQTVEMKFLEIKVMFSVMCVCLFTGGGPVQDPSPNFPVQGPSHV